MSAQEEQRLLEKYRQGQCTAEEQLLLDHWFDELGHERPPLHFASETKRKQVEKRLFNRIYRRIRTPQRLSQPKWHIDKLSWQVAASLILFLGLGWVTYRIYSQSTAQRLTTPQRVIANLPGEHKQVVLPDGSVVQLNGRSTLTFTQQFSDTARVLFLEGEAFFEVTKDPKRPFTVWAGGVGTTALGTSFNIRALGGRPTKVSLLTGKVRVSPINKLLAGQWLLDPGRQLTYQPDNGQATITLFQPADVLAWREGNLYVDDEPLADVLRQISQRYRVVIQFNEQQLRRCRVTTRIDKKDTLEDIFQLLSFSHHLIVKRQANRYVVTATGCP
ncbi:FecR family protein [Spirosoma flavum]|uniref:FecR family protein n=1 Tax=Spirosoma flavum TaxID=2048557 RepID=A0ABW6AQS0_9BACT